MPTAEGRTASGAGIDEGRIGTGAGIDAGRAHWEGTGDVCTVLGEIRTGSSVVGRGDAPINAGARFCCRPPERKLNMPLHLGFPGCIDSRFTSDSIRMGR